jgi:hypothetical protein
MGGELSSLHRLIADRVYGPQPARDDRSGQGRRHFEPHAEDKDKHPPEPKPPSPDAAPPEEQEVAPSGRAKLGAIISYQA